MCTPNFCSIDLAVLPLQQRVQVLQPAVVHWQHIGVQDAGGAPRVVAVDAVTCFAQRFDDRRGMPVHRDHVQVFFRAGRRGGKAGRDVAVAAGFVFDVLHARQRRVVRRHHRQLLRVHALAHQVLAHRLQVGKAAVRGHDHVHQLIARAAGAAQRHACHADHQQQDQ